MGDWKGDEIVGFEKEGFEVEIESLSLMAAMGKLLRWGLIFFFFLNNA